MLCTRLDAPEANSEDYRMHKTGKAFQSTLSGFGDEELNSAKIVIVVLIDLGVRFDMRRWVSIESTPFKRYQYCIERKGE